MFSIERKELLNYKGLIEKLRSNGIYFNDIDENNAIKILQERNYYYKLTSYRKLFNKENGKYNIEFAALSNLSVIDMQLRYFLLQLCLDLENSIKTFIMDEITRNPQEDGYTIVEEYKESNKKGYKKSVATLNKSKYLKNVSAKYKNDIPIWVLVEIFDFGNLTNFLKMYSSKYPKNKRVKRVAELCKYIRHIRNAAAHSNVFLVDILSYRISPSASIVSLGDNFNISPEILKYRKLHDLFALIYLHREYCSKELWRYRKKDIVNLAKLARRKSKYFINNDDIVSIYKYIVKILISSKNRKKYEKS